MHLPGHDRGACFSFLTRFDRGLAGQGYTPPDAPASEYQTIPMNKIEDFGVHCKSYYPLDISFFKSSLDAHILDLLWHKYWVNTLSASPLVTTRHLAAGQYADIGTARTGSDDIIWATC